MNRSSLSIFATAAPAASAVAAVGLLATAGVLAAPGVAHAAAGTDSDTSSVPDAVPAPAPLAPLADTSAAATRVGAHFGTGKLVVTIAATDGVPAGTVIDPTGARVAVHVEEAGEAPVDMTCVLEGSSCALPGTEHEVVPGIVLPDYLALPDHATVTLTLVGAPTSGAVLVPGTPVVGYTDSSDTSSPTSAATLQAHGAYRTLAVQLNGPGPLAGSTFSLCATAGSDCSGADAPSATDPDDAPTVETALTTVIATTDAQGRATFPGLHLPGDYRVVQTAAPAGGTVDPTAHTLTVAATTTVTARDEVALLQLGDPVVLPTPAAPPATPPAATAPPSTAPVATPPASAPAPAPAPSAVTPVAPRVDVAEPSLVAGAQQTISLGGFQPFEVVHGVLHSTPVDLGTVTADAEGVATFVFTVPAGLETGLHTVSMTGATGTVVEATFTVTAAAGGPALAYTGTDVVPLAGLGGALVLAGATALLLLRRRRAA